MAKLKSEKTSNVVTIAGATRILGCNRETLRTAIAAKYVDTVELACGQRVVVLKSAKQWNRSRTKK